MKIDITKIPNTDEYYSAESRKQRKARSRLAADIRAFLIMLLVLILAIGVMIGYYSELMARGEGYRNQRPEPEVNIAGHVREYPEHCGKLQFKSVEAAKKLGC